MPYTTYIYHCDGILVNLAGYNLLKNIFDDFEHITDFTTPSILFFPLDKPVKIIDSTEMIFGVNSPDSLNSKFLVEQIPFSVIKVDDGKNKTQRIEKILEKFSGKYPGRNVSVFRNLKDDALYGTFIANITMKN